jgi:hypothetical protein
MGLTLKNTLLTNPDTSFTAQPIQVKPLLTSSFDYEYLVELVDRFEEHNQTEDRAAINMDGDRISLVIVSKRGDRVQNYYFANSPELYAGLELAYNCLLEDSSNGDEFIDRWESFMTTIEHAKITDVEFD